MKESIPDIEWVDDTYWLDGSYRFNDSHTQPDLAFAATALEALRCAEAKALDDSKPLEERRKNALAELERYIGDGIEKRNEAQAFLGCMLKAKLRDSENVAYVKPLTENQYTFWRDDLGILVTQGRRYVRDDAHGKSDYSRRSLYQWPLPRQDKPEGKAWQGLDDTGGLCLLLEDFLEKRYDRKIGMPLARVLSHFVLCPDTAKSYKNRFLLEELRSHKINPFAKLDIAFAGAYPQFINELSIKALLNSFIVYDGKHPLTFESAHPKTGAYDYVLSGNMLNYDDFWNDHQNMCTPFCAAANLLKPDGKAVHVVDYASTIPLFRDADFHRFAGVRAAEIDQTPDNRIAVFEKTNNAVITPEMLQEFLTEHAKREADAKAEEAYARTWRGKVKHFLHRPTFPADNSQATQR